MDFEEDIDRVLELAGPGLAFNGPLLLVGLSSDQADSLITRFGIRKLSLLYDSSRDKNSNDACHEAIDSKGPTLVLVIRKGVLHCSPLTLIFLYDKLDDLRSVFSLLTLVEIRWWHCSFRLE